MHTILDPHGTPYGGQRNNHDQQVNRGGSGYESVQPPELWTYGSELVALATDEYTTNNKGGVA